MFSKGWSQTNKMVRELGLGEGGQEVISWTVTSAGLSHKSGWLLYLILGDHDEDADCHNGDYWSQLGLKLCQK